MAVSLLHVLLAGNEIGLIRQSKGKVTFAYHEGWRQNPRALPLSLSMPLVKSEHDTRAVEAYIWGLLPDNDRILDRWAKRFQVSPRNPFALIANVGEDCAGAVQFARPERLETILAASGGQVDWLTDGDIAGRLRTLRSDQAAWRMPGDLGQFSLAGAQPKIALLFLNGRWGVPQGRMPTTHILKPPIPGHQGHVENEHFCLSLAKALDLPAATSEVRYFGDEPAIVVQRYDRADAAALAASAATEAAAAAASAASATSADQSARWAAQATQAAARASFLGEFAKTQPILRLHQEDLCQALGLLPSMKYQNEGGPGPTQVVELLRSYSSRPKDDVATFVSALFFNWMIAGPDAHAKNYSLLHGAGGQVRLAPLYDLSSVLPYDSYDLRKIKLAMKVGGRYLLDHVGVRQWEALAKELRLDREDLLRSLEAKAIIAPDAIRQTLAQIRAEGLKDAIFDRLADRLVERAQACLAGLRMA